MIKAIFILSIIILFLSLIVIMLIKRTKALKKEKKELENVILQQKNNLSVLKKYQEQNQDVDAEKSKLLERLRKVESDEERRSIITDIIHNNNNKLQNCNK